MLQNLKISVCVLGKVTLIANKGDKISLAIEVFGENIHNFNTINICYGSEVFFSFLKLCALAALSTEFYTHTAAARRE